METLPASIWKLLILFFVLLALFDVIFVRTIKFGKVAWKRTEYVWLSVAALSLITLSFQVRSWLAENKAELAKYKAESSYSTFIDYAGPKKPPNYICRTFIRSEYSPSNLEDIQKVYDKFCEWNKQLLKNLPEKIYDDLPEIQFEKIKPKESPKERVLSEYLDTLKMYLDDYEQLREEFINSKQKIERNWFEQILFYISPILICIALALKITKVTGEIKLEKT